MFNFCKARLVLFLLLLLVIAFFIIYVKNRSTRYTDIKPFQLYTKDNKLINNVDFEYEEQLLLKRYLSKDDVILQLGGNIGTSCIYADKLLSEKTSQMCVEPNSNLWDTLKKNKDLHNAQFHIVEGLVSNKNCNYKKVSHEADTLELGTYYSHDIKDIDRNSVRCYDLYALEQKIGKKVNVVFMDCEGCACDFFSMYEDILHRIDTIILEKDQTHICDYDNYVEPLLKKHKFKKVKSKFNVVYREVWRKEWYYLRYIPLISKLVK